MSLCPVGGPDRYKLSQRLAVKLRCEWGRLSGANDYRQPEQWEDVLGNVLSGDMSEEQMKAELRLKLKPQPGAAGSQHAFMPPLPF